MTDQQVKARVAIAIDCLRQEQPPLDFGSVHERTTAQRLAVHLFEGWNVDCEYDRDGSLQKKLSRKCQNKSKEAVYPDIIIHHRGKEGADNNLLVIEIKKNSKEDPCDKAKLKLFTNPSGDYKYQYGLYINISINDFDCTWYKKGQQADQNAARNRK